MHTLCDTNTHVPHGLGLVNMHVFDLCEKYGNILKMSTVQFFFLWCSVMVVVVAFFLACKDFGRMFDHSFPVCAFKKKFSVESSSCTLIPLCMPGSVHSVWASQDNCGRMFPDKVRVSSFPDMFPHHACIAA